MLNTITKCGPLLDLFTTSTPEWGLSEAANQLGLPRSSAHALMSSLVEIGLLRHRGNGRYRIGWRALDMSITLRNSVDIAASGGDVIRELARTLHETVHLAVLDQWKAVYVDKAVGQQMISVAGIKVGSANNPHSSAIGKVLLAQHSDREIERQFFPRPLPRMTTSTVCSPRELLQEINKIRGSGYAFDLGESNPEVRCVAAPIFDETGLGVAALSISIPANRFQAVRGRAKSAVLTGAAAITRRLVAGLPKVVS